MNIPPPLRAATALLAAASITLGAPRAAVAQAPPSPSPSSSTATPTAAPPSEAARREFAQGVASYDHKPPEYEQALAHFRTAYREQPLAAIKRNIALCLRALGRNAEAVTALEEMLAEGGDALKPELREAAKRAMAEMAPKVAQVRVSVGFPGRAPGTSPEAEVSIDGVVIAPNRMEASLHVEPGEHVFRARATGHADAEVKVSLDAGGPEATVSLELLSMRRLEKGKLHVRSNLPSAEIAIDGVVLGKGQWAGPLFAGRHGIDVSSPVGRYTGEVVIEPGEDRVVTVTVARTGSYAYGAGDAAPAVAPTRATDAPPVYGASPTKAPTASKPLPLVVAPLPTASQSESAAAVAANADLLKDADAAREAARSKPYILAGVGVHSMTVNLRSGSKDVNSQGRNFVGASAILRTGLAVTPWFQIGILGEVGAASTAYFGVGDDSRKVSTIIWGFAPEARFRTAGRFRLFAGVALGLTGIYATSRGAGGDDTRGGSGLLGLVNAGAQLDLHKVFVELGGFADLRDVSSFASSPGGVVFDQDVAVRYGVQLLLGKEF